MSLSLPPPQRRSAAVSRFSHRSAKASPPLRPSSLFPPLASQHHSTPSTPELRIVLRKNPPDSPNSLRASASFRSCRFRVGAYPSGGAVHGEEGAGHLDFDSFLSVAELLCLVSAAVVSVVFAARRAVFGAAGDRVLGWVVVALVGGVASGAWVRRRQWRRVFEQPGTVGGANVNLVERIEKLEEDLRSSATMIRVLSRQLEKLGIRFRVTRKALKEPIAEAAVLAQKNSEATRALAMQEDILEKELGEIQKVLLAMQDQQQKQLELILAIGKTGKLWESRRGPNQEHTNESTSLPEEGSKQLESTKLKPL
ncbi:LOW QUALITY PROTEIN: uncharacterized protein LOC115676882 [Syzygium oleosum]|uniref:LOW QUALITY PROTEIN: uncharacterized protein LOC115676882 n=1 Tax=Syzygium oleosum TaxID=219896 RepID=UPI0024BAE3A0|nr:LOW QUALITY PROTEIN: uncharacterized protein LOC115676882 [Syzygium oleosum]